MQACDSIEGVTAQRFAETIVPANRPVVLRGLAADWPAVRAGRISDAELNAYLKRFSTSAPVEFMTAPPEVRGEFFYGETLRTRNFRKGQAPLSAVLDQLTALKASADPASLYVQSLPVDIALPGFAAHNVLPLLPAQVRPRVWIGNAVRVQTHYDLSDNIAVVVVGRRRFTLFPPEQLPNLYVGPFDNTLAGSPVSLADIEAPDLDRFPRLADALAAGLTAELEPGDAIYIPYGWWHHVRSLSAINMLANYWWSESPAHLPAPYGTLLLAMLTVRDMPERYRDVWKTMFDHFVFGQNGNPGAHLGPEDLGALAKLSPEDHAGALAQVIRGLAAQGAKR